MNTIIPIFLSITITVYGRNVPKISRRIVNGATADPHQFPYQAILSVDSQNQENAICGGTIISNEWILTAAHCSLGIETPLEQHINDIKVIVGVNNLNDSNRIVADVEKFILHPNYTMAPNLANDIALIKLRKPLFLKKPRLSSIELPTDGEETMLGQALTSGHGSVKRFTNQGSQDLLWLNVRILLDDECSVYFFGQHIYDSKTMVCTKADPWKSVCNGDSGGPLVRKMANGNDILIGVTSFTDLFCSSYLPSVYTKVSAYRSWIRKETLI